MAARRQLGPAGVKGHNLRALSSFFGKDRAFHLAQEALKCQDVSRELLGRAIQTVEAGKESIEQ